jgi:hypothetical protein
MKRKERKRQPRMILIDIVPDKVKTAMAVTILISTVVYAGKALFCFFM